MLPQHTQSQFDSQVARQERAATMKSFVSEHASRSTYICAILVSVGSFLWGYDSGIFATAQAQEYFESFFNPSPTMLGAIVSTYTAGGAVGCLLSWPVGNRFGRRGTMLIGAAIAAVGTALQTGAQNIPTLIAGRLIAGIAIGVIYFAIPQYQSEIAPAGHRGSIVGLHPQFIGFGYAVSNWMGYAVSFGKGEFTYRFSVGLQVLWAVCLLAGAFTIPESPRYLIEKGNNDKALQQLRRLRVDDEAYIQAEFRQMVEQITWDKENEMTSIAEIWKKPSYRRRMLLGCFIQAAQQICGISAINYYQTIMYRSLGINGRLVLALAGVWGLVGPAANIICLLFIIDRVRRRTMLMAGSLAMAVDIAIVMAIVAVYGGTDNTIANGFGIFFLLLFSCLFSLSWNAGAPVYCTEIFPTVIRATGGGVSTFCSFLIQIILAQASPTALANIGWRYYIFFVVMNLTVLVVTYFCVPETSGRTLEEVNEVFNDRFVTVRLEEAAADGKTEPVEATANEKTELAEAVESAGAIGTGRV